jgi:hypothetical protein
MTTTEELPQIPNDEVLALLTSFTARYSRKISISFQAWDFSHSQTVALLPEHTPNMRRAIVRKISEFVRICVLQDVIATMPEIEGTVGDQPLVLETLKRSLGLIQ